MCSFCGYEVEGSLTEFCGDCEGPVREAKKVGDYVFLTDDTTEELVTDDLKYDPYDMFRVNQVEVDPQGMVLYHLEGIAGAFYSFEVEEA